MKRKSLLLLVTTMALVTLLLSAGPALAGKVYIMKGILSAVDQGCNTAVVKVPLASGKVFVVAGTLAPDVMLKRGGTVATLGDFQVGEKVTVKWRSTARGHLILALIAR